MKFGNAKLGILLIGFLESIIYLSAVCTFALLCLYTLKFLNNPLAVATGFIWLLCMLNNMILFYDRAWHYYKQFKATQWKNN